MNKIFDNYNDFPSFEYITKLRILEIKNGSVVSIVKIIKKILIYISICKLSMSCQAVLNYKGYLVIYPEIIQN